MTLKDAFTPLHLETQRLVLRHFRPADLPTLVAYRNDEEVARYQGWSSLSEAQGADFIARQSVQAIALPGEWLQIALELRETGQHIGDVAFCVDGSGQATFGYTLSRRHQGRGLMREAVRGLLDYLFGTLELHRVSAALDVRNTPSKRLLEHLGFRLEGCSLEAYWLKGEWTSEYHYALLRREWQAQKSES